MFHAQKAKALVTAAGLLLTVTAAGCQDAKEASPEDAKDTISVDQVADRPMLSIRLRKESAEPTRTIADIVFAKPDDGKGPRVAEIFLDHSEGLTYLSSTPGPALEEAKKTLVAQEQGPGTVRLVVLGLDNANTIGKGTLASVVFETATSGPKTLEIRSRGPLFAPGEANEGLLIGDPVVIE